MRSGVLFRIRYIFFSTVALLALHGPAEALRLEVTSASYPVESAPIASLEGKAPPAGDQRHGFFATPLSNNHRLSLEYRADFPLSVTFSTDGALGGDRVAPTGAMNLTTKVVFSDVWWWPRVSASLQNCSTEEIIRGRIEVGMIGFRSEWKVRF